MQGGGPLLTDTIEQSKGINSHSELRERAEAQSENHAFRGAVLRESSKTVSASVPCRKLPVTLDRSRNKFGMTLKEMTLVCGFTMAEILLSLTIIGVVAAITLPSLTGNINERTWNTQRKALYARFSQAIALMPALNGYGTLTEDSSSGASDAVDTAAETFITSGLSKVMKINNICDNEHLEDCGIVSKVIALDGTVAYSSLPENMNVYNDTFNYVSVLTPVVAGFETANGESVAVYYNPKCSAERIGSQKSLESGEIWHAYFAQPYLCANFVYDLNGNKGPNTMGKDIGFISVLYSVDSKVVAPMPLSKDLDGLFTQPEAVKACTAYDADYRLPNIEELYSIYYNKILVKPTGNDHWSATIETSNNAWIAGFSYGFSGIYERSSGGNVRCVKR